MRRELEPFDRRRIPNAWCGRTVLYSSTQASSAACSSSTVGVAAIMDAEELGTKRFVPALHFPCGGRGSRRGQQMPNTVLGADPVEHHFRARAGRPEAAGEDLAIVSEDLLGMPCRRSAASSASHTEREVDH